MQFAINVMHRLRAGPTLTELDLHVVKISTVWVARVKRAASNGPVTVFW